MCRTGRVAQMPYGHSIERERGRMATAPIRMTAGEDSRVIVSMLYITRAGGEDEDHRRSAVAPARATRECPPSPWSAHATTHTLRRRTRRTRSFAGHRASPPTGEAGSGFTFGHVRAALCGVACPALCSADRTGLWQVGHTVYPLSSGSPSCREWPSRRSTPF